MSTYRVAPRLQIENLPFGRGLAVNRLQVWQIGDVRARKRPFATKLLRDLGSALVVLLMYFCNCGHEVPNPRFKEFYGVQGKIVGKTDRIY